MKISLFSILFTILIFLLFFTVFTSCIQVVPYSREGIFTNMYPYTEGFEYTDSQNNKSIDSYTQNDITPISKDNQYMSFSGSLLSSPNNTNMNPVDIYSQAQGSTDCKSYGLANSKGFLCMNPEQVRLLTTRGGNSSSGEMQIGASK